MVSEREPRKPWQMELGEYVRQGEPDRAEKARSWQTAIGLQQVDGLEVSDYLIDTARLHIEGAIDTAGARRRIESYYEARAERASFEDDSEEADLVSQRIVELLGEQAFQFSPAMLAQIHRRLFEGLLDAAGAFRDYNIRKKEWVLNGASVTYAPADSIVAALDYDFGQERGFSYGALPVDRAIEHLANFVSGIWQIHPFCEGNTRTTAIFLIKYLDSLGFAVTNEPFERNSWYFRNALVRANYVDYESGVSATSKPLVRFLENVVLGTRHELRNRELHVDYRTQEAVSVPESAQSAIPKCNSCTLDCTLECTLGELAVLRELAGNPKMTQEQVASLLGVSVRTVKSRTASLRKKGLLSRAGGKRSGWWEIPAAALVELRRRPQDDLD